MIYQDWSMKNPYVDDIRNQSPCVPYEEVITNVRLARAYVPFQKLCTVLSPEEALQKGTAFPELYSPYFKNKHNSTNPLMEGCGDDYE